jgi:hypothetical protein
MRCICLLLMASSLAACSTAPEPITRTAKGEGELQRLLAGKAAGPPISCLQSYRANDMSVIDDSTIAFRRGRDTVYVNHLRGACSNLGTGFYTLVTRTPGSNGLCRGDIAEVADVQNGITVGSCVLGDFTPYTRPRG